MRNQIASGEDPRPQFRRQRLQLPPLRQERGGLLPDGTAGHGTGAQAGRADCPRAQWPRGAAGRGRIFLLRGLAAAIIFWPLLTWASASMRGAAPLCTPRERALRPAPRPTFSRRESRQRYARNLLVPGPSGTRGRTPLDSPTLCPSGIVRDNLNPQASSGATHLPRHGLKTQSVSLMKPKEKSKTDLPTNVKWQIGLFLWYKPYRGGAGTAGERSVPLGGFQRAQPLARLW